MVSACHYSCLHLPHLCNICSYYSWKAWPWRWRHYDPHKYWQLFTCPLPQTFNMLIDFLSFFLSFFVQSASNQMLPGAVTYIIIYFQNSYKEMSTHFSKHVSCSIPSHIIDIYLKHSQNGWYFEWNTRGKSFVCMQCNICSVE